MNFLNATLYLLAKNSPNPGFEFGFYCCGADDPNRWLLQFFDFCSFGESDRRAIHQQNQTSSKAACFEMLLLKSLL